MCPVIHDHLLDQGKWASYGLLPTSPNTNLLDKGHIYLFKYYQWLPLHNLPRESWVDATETLWFATYIVLTLYRNAWLTLLWIGLHWVLCSRINVSKYCGAVKTTSLQYIPLEVKISQWFPLHYFSNLQKPYGYGSMSYVNFISSFFLL